MKLIYAAIFLGLLTLSFRGHCKQIVMLFAHSFGPYVVEQESKGVELQIIREALEIEGYELVPVFTELSQIPGMFAKNMVDGVQSSFNINKSSQGFYADPAIEYHDFLFSLDERNLLIKQPKDLQKYSLIAFQNAHLQYPKWLPDGYTYSQTAKQIDQVRLLQLGLVDVVLSDINIFNHNVQYYHQLLGKDLKPIRVHYFSPAFEYGPVFKSEDVVKAFNKGLKSLRASGRYAEIISSLAELDPAILRD